jgi:hypothetical protein
MYPPRAVTTTPVKINCRTQQSPLSRTQRLPLANVPPPTWGGSAHRVCCNHSSALHPVTRRPQNGWHAAQAAMTPHPPRSVNVCVTSDIKQTAAAFRSITVPRQELRSRFSSSRPGRTGGPVGPASLITQAGVGFSGIRVCVSDESLGRPLGSSAVPERGRQRDFTRGFAAAKRMSRAQSLDRLSHR